MRGFSLIGKVLGFLKGRYYFDIFVVMEYNLVFRVFFMFEFIYENVNI